MFRVISEISPNTTLCDLAELCLKPCYEVILFIQDCTKVDVILGVLLQEAAVLVYFGGTSARVHRKPTAHTQIQWYMPVSHWSLPILPFILDKDPTHFTPYVLADTPHPLLRTSC